MNTIDKLGGSQRPLIISCSSKPMAVAYPYDGKKSEIKAGSYFGFLGKGDTGEKFLAGVRRSPREKDYVKSLVDTDVLIAATAVAEKLKLATRNKKHFKNVPNLEFY